MKRTLTLLLCLLMVLGLLPAAAMAECNHENTYSWVGYDEEEVKFTSIDDRYHKVEGTVTIHIVCDDCGQDLGTETQENYVDSEQWHDYDENGVCRQCGHKNACKHVNTYTYAGFDPDTVKYTAVDDKYHKAEGPATIYTHCDECGMMLSSEQKENYVDAQRWHDYDENGVCRQCGHKNACKHENTYSYTNFDESAVKYTSLDEKYHRGEGPGTVYTYCEDCGLMLNSEKKDNCVEEKRWHNYDESGVCSVCGHKNACKHENTWTDENFGPDAKYTSVNEKYHKVEGTATIRTICDDCGQEISTEEKENYVIARQWHDYDKDGVCRQCGHKTGCQHASTYSYRNWNEMNVADDGNGTTHTISGSGYKVKCCNDCGMELSRTPFTNEKITEQHYFNSDGVCYDCGYKNTCKHEHTDEYTSIYTDRLISAEAIDETSCSITGPGVKYVYCEDCGITLKSEQLGTITEQWSHYFVNGVCEYCGYKNTCKHTNVNEYSYADYVTSYSDINDIGHTIHGDIVTYTRCNDCGAEIKRTVQENSTLTENHNYRNDVCTQCGHVNACKHANKATQVSFAKDEVTWTCVDSETHKGTGMGWVNTYCKDCEESFGWSDKKQAEEVRPHQFDKDGKCALCGYVKGAEPALYAAAKVNTLKTQAKKSAKLQAPKVKKATYQWYYRTSKTAAWQSMGKKGTKQKLSVKAAMAVDGYQYRCVIKSPTGGITYTDIYEMYVFEPLKIKKQPKWSKASTPGSKVTLSITATGADSYQWLTRPNSSAAWSKIDGATSASYTVDVQDGMAGRQYVCEVTGRAGKATSKAATVKMAKVAAPKIKKQPTWKKAVKPGEQVTLSVTAINVETYQWYYRTSAKGAWIIMNGETKPTVIFKAAANANGYQYKCTVKGKGGTVDSKPVTLKVAGN